VTPGDTRLVAYIVYRAGQDLTSSEVRSHAAAHLPAYMVPAIFMTLAKLPLAASGKLNRAALPDPFAAASLIPRQATPPAPGTEQIIADIWRKVLRTDAVMSDDNFFDLGGYSLLSLRVVHSVKRRIGYRLDARALYFNNLRQIAQLVDAAGSLETTSAP
jgi:hypothetical protein